MADGKIFGPIVNRPMEMQEIRVPVTYLDSDFPPKDNPSGPAILMKMQRHGGSNNGGGGGVKL